MVGLSDITELHRRVVDTARALEPALLTVEVAQQMLRDVTAVKNAAATMEALLATRIADTGEWRRAGVKSAEEHVARLTGTSVGRARQALETAARLEGLDATADAARSGLISPEQAAAVSDAAAAAPSAEQRLIESARRTSLADLQVECTRVKAAADRDPDETYRRNRAARRLRLWDDGNGVAKLFGATTPDQMAIIKKAVEQRADALFRAARTEGRREPRGAYLVDALEQICAEWLDGPEGGRSQKRRRPKPVFLGIVRADLEALRRGAVEGDEICEIAGLGPVPVRVAESLLGDSVLHLVLTKGTAVGTTVNLRRGPNTAQRVALLATQPGCSITGCTSPFTEIDHDDPWARCRVTELVNLWRYCTHHHGLKTRGWAPIEEEGTRLLVPPDDRRHPGRAHGPPVESVP